VGRSAREAWGGSLAKIDICFEKQTGEGKRQKDSGGKITNSAWGGAIDRNLPMCRGELLDREKRKNKTKGGD